MRKLKSTVFTSFVLLASNAFGEAPVTEAKTVDGSNVLLYAMASLAIILLLVIFVLAGVLKATFKSKLEELTKHKATLIAIGFIGLSRNLFAESAKKGSLDVVTPIAGMHPFVFYILFFVLIAEIFVVLWMCLIILRMVVKQKEKKAMVAEAKPESTFWKTFVSRKIFGVAPVETDKDVMLDHEYDGIRELDNDLPPWWKYGFYMTIVSAIVYFVSYHVTHTSLSSIQEYEKEMQDAEVSVAAYRSKMALDVDESNAVFLEEKEKIESGKSIFIKNCAVCHGNEGQGLVGPNFTDNYWLYGNAPGDLFGIVKNGTNKGMRAWKDELSPIEIQNVISYIHTFKGSHPANPKAAEGLLMEDRIPAETTGNSSSDTIQLLEIKS